MSRHTTHDTDSRRSAPHDAPATWNLRLATTMTQTGEVCLKAYLDWQQEVARFVAARLEQDRRTQQSLAVCRNAGDVLKLQQDWALSAIRDYYDEADRLTQIASRIAQVGTAVTATSEKPMHASAERPQAAA